MLMATRVRLHWILGTAILVTVCLLPLLLWWYGLDRISWRVELLIATAGVVGLATLLFKRVKTACEKTIDVPPQADADTLRDIPDDIFCPACGYNLHGAPGANCSECGYSLENIRSNICRIPWARRREVGRFRGYWSTVWMVAFHNRTFCEEYAHSVSFSDARAFRYVTVLHAYLPLLFATLLLYATTPAEPYVALLHQMMTTGMVQYGATIVDRAYAETWPVVVLHVCYLLFLLAATAAPSYLLYSRFVGHQRQHNILAMSYYTCGPLAFAAFLFVGLWAVIGLGWPAEVWPAGRSTGLSCVLAGGVAVVTWWWSLVRLGRRTMPQLRHKVAALAVSVPALWLALGILLLGLLPLALIYILIVVVSFWD
jgi:hypothetical protein